MTDDARRQACAMIETMTQIVVLNGGSSAGKSSIARALQLTLPAPPWLTFGVDALIDALPGRGDDPPSR
jgi:chloramphenicol 3-O phosphotransferase